MQECYGTTQVKEILMNRKDIECAIRDYLVAAHPAGYDFDMAKPFYLWSEDGIEVSVRYVQSKITREREPRGFTPKLFKAAQP